MPYTAVFLLVPIGKPLKLAPAVPPANTGHATFAASGAPSVVFVQAFIQCPKITFKLLQVTMPVYAGY